MQDRYAGDIGDFIKLAILRELMPDYRLGVAWWLYPDEQHNGNGRHIGYLQQPDKWRALDPVLFDGLADLVESGSRSVRSLQDAHFLPGAVFADEVIPTAGTSSDRRAGRLAWFERVKAAMERCDLIFLDPDNGLETAGYNPGALVSGKSVSLFELAALSGNEKSLVVYHHQTRRKGGHFAELDHWAERLRAAGFRTVDAIRSHRYSPRAFFLLNGVPQIRQRAANLAQRCVGTLSWHPDMQAASPTGTSPRLMPAST